MIEEAGEKVTVAEDAYSLVDKYMRKLDQELLKFKLELEADNRGITEILEKRSLEMDQQQVSYVRGLLRLFFWTFFRNCQQLKLAKP